MGISTHVLDTAAGRPGVGIAVSLLRWDDGAWIDVASGVTDDDGRVPGGLVADADLRAASYRIVFATGAYFAARDERTFYPRALIEFDVDAPDEHYHVPLLVSPWSYSTYRGS